MRSSVGQFFRRAFHTLTGDPPIHPIDRRLAKEWIKRRLVALFPELRNNPRALEQAYRDLSLEPRPGNGPDEPETVFDMSLPTEVQSPGSQI
jgi:hypothetical protein